MIVKEFYEKRNDGVSLYRTYSDINHYIRQVETGNVYAEAIDIENANFTYEETDEIILTPEERMMMMEEEMRLQQIEMEENLKKQEEIWNESNN